MTSKQLFKEESSSFNPMDIADEDEDNADLLEQNDGYFDFPQQQQPISRGTKLLQNVQIVTPGELITAKAEGVLRGHGTYVQEGKLYSCVCGVVERVNKLISVRPLRARYTGEIGDVVVGRVTELRVGAKKWKVDIQGRQDAALLLSSVNLPGGIQRRKTYEDQLNMRNLYVENDLISAEVQQFFGDGTMSLQTRSARYGKLENGLFVTVYPTLVKRCKRHFHTFPFGVQAILGNNGYIWLTVAEENQTKEEQPFMSMKKASVGYKTISGKDRENLTRTRNAIMALQTMFLPIYPETIMDVYESSLHLQPKQMISKEMIPLITAKAADRIQKQYELEQQQ